MATPAQQNLIDACRRIVEAGGGRYKGIQKGVPELGLSALILFDDGDLLPNQSSTMALKPEDLTAANVRIQIRVMRAAFAEDRRRKDLVCE